MAGIVENMAEELVVREILLEEALKYCKANYSVIPVSRSKKPLLASWETYQQRCATEDEIIELWRLYPYANIGLVTGNVSGFCVVDADGSIGVESLKQYIPGGIVNSYTPNNGQHFYFSCPDSVIGNATRFLPGVDFRGNGGYVVAPPSVGSNKNKYSWQMGCSIFEKDLTNIPSDLLDALNSTRLRPIKSNVVIAADMFCDGRRDTDLFTTANMLFRSGMNYTEVEQIILRLASSCNPPFSEQEAVAKVESAMKRAVVRERNLFNEVREYIANTAGEFSINDLYSFLTIGMKGEKLKVQNIMKKFTTDGFVERYGRRNGMYRRIMKEEEQIDFIHASSDLVDIKWPFHIEEYVQLMPKNICVIAGTPNSGKGHPDGTKLLTPDGWENIEDLSVGSEIFAADGTITKITGKFPRGEQQCFEFCFSDRTSVVTDFEHLWTVQDKYFRSSKTTGRGNKNKNYKQWKTLEAYKLLSMFGGFGKCKTKSIIIPLNKPLEFDKKDVHMDPYLLGLFLGDGCLCRGMVGFSTRDIELVDYIRKFYEVTNSNDSIDYRVKKAMPDVERIGLKGKKSHDKFVPSDYLYNSIDIRLSVLNGLMDTDGTIGKNGKSVCFTTVSDQLADDVSFLVRSLGGKVTRSSRHTNYTLNGEKKRGRLSHNLFIVLNDFPIFKLKRKLDRNNERYKYQNKKISEIKNAGIQKTTCISIANESGLYITNDFIVTHNTAFVLNVIYNNMHKHDIYYFSSEMGPTEFKSRLSMFDIPLDNWKFTAIERAGDFHDVIRPDAINIIDFLEVHEEFFKVGLFLKQIYDKLNTGVAIICLQRNKGNEAGLGGFRSLEKPRLYINMSSDQVEIIKAKNWQKPAINPNGLRSKFVLQDGWKFESKEGWYRME